MTGEDYLKLKARADAMDDRLLELCNTCGIFFPVSRGQIQDAVEAHGLAVVMAVVKRLSQERRDYTLTIVKQFDVLLKAKMGGSVKNGKYRRRLEGISGSSK